MTPANEKTTRIAFLGLGVMGFPMAGHLKTAGYQVTVYNRTKSKSVAWVNQNGGSFGETPARAATGADLVIACVGNDDDLRSVCLGSDGAFSGMSHGSKFVDHTTVSATVTQELYEIAQSQGIAFLDAPVSGGQAGAENGALSIMCGGDDAVYDWAEPVIGVYSKLCRRIGPSGSGQLPKCAIKLLLLGWFKDFLKHYILLNKQG
jgi:3-hydroxyisobutyrate dehydrogenase